MLYTISFKSLFLQLFNMIRMLLNEFLDKTEMEQITDKTEMDQIADCTCSDIPIKREEDVKCENVGIRGSKLQNT